MRNLGTGAEGGSPGGAPGVHLSVAGYCFQALCSPAFSASGVRLSLAVSLVSLEPSWVRESSHVVMLGLGSTPEPLGLWVCRVPGSLHPSLAVPLPLWLTWAGVWPGHPQCPLVGDVAASSEARSADPEPHPLSFSPQGPVSTVSPPSSRTGGLPC